MAKTKEEPKETRARSRGLEYANLCLMLNALVVLDREAKDYIKGQFTTTMRRLEAEVPKSARQTTKYWEDLTKEDLRKEYIEFEKQFKMLNIFSDEFYRVISNHWSNMLSTFNPHCDWYLD